MYGSHDPAVCGGMFAGRASAIMGLADEATRLGEEAVTLARSLDHPFSLGLALTFRAASAQALGDRRCGHRQRRRGDDHRPGAGVPPDARLVPGRLRLGRSPAGRRGPRRHVDRRGDRDHACDGIGSVPLLPHGVARGGVPRRWPAGRRPPGRARWSRGGRSHAPSASTRRSSIVFTAKRCSSPTGTSSAAAAAFRRGVEVATRQGANLFALRSAVRLTTLANGTNGTRQLLAVVRQSLPPSSDLAEATAADALLAT